MSIRKSAYTINIPDLDYLSVLFESDVAYTAEDTVIHAEADDPRISYTKSQARSWTKRLAYLFRHHYQIGQHEPGKDVVTVYAIGSSALPMLFQGILGAGGVYSAASVAYTQADLVRTIKAGPSNLLICSPELLDIARKAAQEAGLPEDRLIVIDSRPELNLKTGAGQSIPVPKRELQWTKITDKKTLAKMPVALLYSSGTTGLPKGVIITHQMIVQGAVSVTVNMKEWREKRTAKGIAPYKYITIAHLPTSHIAGLQGYMINPSLNNATTYWMPRFDFPKFLEYSKKYQATFMLTVPPIWLLVEKSPLVKDQFSHVELAIGGAAPLGLGLQKAATKKLGAATGRIAPLNQTWGLTETCGSATWVPWGENHDFGGVGILFPNCEARIVDDNGKDLPDGEPGEIWIRGPNTTPGYWNNPKATRETYHADWLKTGDIGYFLEDQFYCVDRKKELIKYKALQIAPAELEGLLLTHPLIVDAAVIGVADEVDKGNEVPRAYIVADQAKISADEIKAFVKKNLSGYKQLRGGVRFVDAIPKNASGKILRKDLREQAKKEGRAKL